ncbi:DNA endonuclease RBBP8-like [Lineus longissimus]|uniref:DNA endonuclease RBBP8-like n=1 Tax=Lineus longissimus TaxID=88925 RepID=UPI00315D1391
MHGHDCAGCKDYYDYLPEEERQKRMQESSRHRAYYVPPDTPPNFWCLNIPSTQSLSMNMKGHLDESFSAGPASIKSPEPKPAKAKGKEKFRRKNKLTILPPKFDDKS